MLSQDESPCRCHACGTLIATRNGRVVRIQYKTLRAAVFGAAEIDCRKCGAANRIEVKS